MTKPNQQADIKNANKASNGVNTTYAKAQGNKGKQNNPNQQAVKKKSK